VEINKILQANMDGDGIGGSINLVTKTAGERPTIALSGVRGYMPILGGRGQVESTGTIGQRFGHEKRFGVLVGGSYDWSGRGIDDIEPVSDIATLPNGSTALWKDSIDVREYRYYRTRWGIAGGVDYKLGEGSSLYARVVAGVRFETTNLKTVSFNTTTNSLSDQATGSYLKILPSVSLRYAFTGNTNLRLAYGRGCLARVRRTSHKP
jgi:outer membrane receptor protein involved in Fe transport